MAFAALFRDVTQIYPIAISSVIICLILFYDGINVADSVDIIKYHLDSNARA